MRWALALASVVFTVKALGHAARESGLAAVLPDTRGLLGYLLSGAGSVREALSVRAHFRTALSSHRVTVAMLVALPALALGGASRLRKRTSATLLLAWVCAVAYKIRRGIAPRAFPPHILKLLDEVQEDSSAAAPRSLNDLTDEELALIRFITSITSDLANNPGKRERVWSMRGGGKGDARRQLGFTSIRYHLAFTGYAFAVCCSRTPCYVGRLRRVLQAVIEHMLEDRVWGYMDHYWKEGLNPFQCAENIMWSGHVLQLATMYEALTGDGRYRRKGGLVATNSATGLCFTSDVVALAQTLAQSMRNNPTGGVPCEPGLVFFQCNTHPHIAMRMLEKITAADHASGRGGAVPLDFSAERKRWEKYALLSMHSAVKTGAFKMLSVAQQGAAAEMGTIPFGHMGGDGWCLSYYFPWATSEAVPRAIWRDISAPILRQFATFDGPPCRKPWAPRGKGKGSSVPNTCCFNLNIPSSAWASSLLPAAAQAEDWDTYTRIQSWIARYYLREGPEGTLRLCESVEWEIGNTAQYLLGVSIANGSSFRQLVQCPPPLSFFRGPMLEDVESGVDVFRCRRGERDGELRIGLVLPAGAFDQILLRMSNVTRVDRVAIERSEGGRQVEDVIRHTFVRATGELKVHMQLERLGGSARARVFLRVWCC
eukprot:g3635.t1